MTKLGLIKELESIPDDAEINVVVEGSPPWHSIFTVSEELDPGGKLHVIISAYKSSHRTKER